MGDKLLRPPLAEAVCEFRFEESDQWDWTIPGSLYERLKGEFPERLQSLGIFVEPLGSGSANAALRPAPERIQMRRTDGTALVQVGPHLLSINHLQPYPTWENFLQMILSILHEYQEVAPAAPFQRIGLRYINHFPLEENAEIGHFFTLVPNLRRTLVRPLLAFYQRYELEQTDPAGTLIHQTGSQATPDGSPILVLDLDMYSESVTELLDNATLAEWLERAHDRIYEAFVDSLNPDLYTKLKEGS